MRVTLNIEKRYAYAIIGLLVFFGGIFVVNAAWTAPASGVSHDGASVKTSYGGVDYDFDSALAKVKSDIGDAGTTTCSWKGPVGDSTEIYLDDYISEGGTGICHWQGDTKYHAGYMKVRVATKFPTTTTLRCKEDTNFANKNYYYYACK